MPVVLPGKLKRKKHSVVAKWRRNKLVRKAMKEFRQEHLAQGCAWSGSKLLLQTHHKIPMSVAPQLGMLHSNMVLLNRFVHFWLAHFGNFKTSFLANIDDVIDIAERQYTE